MAARAPELGARGADGGAGERGDLFVGVALHVVEHEDGARAGGDALQRRFEVDPFIDRRTARGEAVDVIVGIARQMCGSA